MKTDPTILIVTPTLGDSPHLDETVRAVARLDLPAEHLLSAPEACLGALESRFPWLRVVADAGRAGGVYGAINSALAASGADWEWFTYINDDDVLLPGFAELVRRHVRLGADPVAYGDVDVIREDGSVVARVTTESSPSWIPALLKQGISPLMQQGMLFHRSTVERLGAFDTRYRLCADLDFWLRALVAGDRFRHHPVRVARFRLRSGQLSGDTGRTIREQSEIVERLLPRPITAARSFLARWRYRAFNLPRYLQRFSTAGIRRSYSLLSTPEPR